MDSTDGLSRGLEVEDTGQPISVPVGDETLGRIINVIGEPVDEAGPVKTKERRSIHQPTPAYTEQSTESAILVTGSTMTGQDILDGYMVVAVTLQMVRPAEFIDARLLNEIDKSGYIDRLYGGSIK